MHLSSNQTQAERRRLRNSGEIFLSVARWRTRFRHFVVFFFYGRHMMNEVVIVGAGAAGLAAALEMQSSGRSFILLEARDRIGGRAFTDRETFLPTPVDLGATWIHSYGPRNPLYEYHRRLTTDEDEGNPTVQSRCLDFDGKPVQYPAWRSAQKIYLDLDEHLDLFALDKSQSDDQSIEQVMQSEYERLVPADGPVKRLVDLLLSGTEQYEASNLSQLSAKYRGFGSGSGYDQSVSFGYGTLLERIADTYNLPIQLNTLVTGIDTTATDQIVVTTQSDTIVCRSVILTVPLGCLKKDTIVFRPPLPDWKRQAIDRMGVGVMNKLIVQFAECFWGDEITSFSHACNERRGRFRYTACIPPPANILVLFVTGDFARELELLTDDDILQEVMAFLRQVFPSCIVPDPIKSTFTRWSRDPLALGAYSNLAVHCSPDTIRDLSKETADGRVQWAGEHANVDDGTDDWSIGCVHSAFQSGLRAAKAIRQQRCSD